MLTQEQIEKLEKFTTHPRYGKLLKSAISSWKKCKPESKHFGIVEIKNKFCRDKSYNGCCLIGASLLNKKANKGMFQSVIDKYELTNEQEVWSLIYGFDNLPENDLNVTSTEYREAFHFGKSVRGVLGC